MALGSFVFGRDPNVHHVSLRLPNGIVRLKSIAWHGKVDTLA